MDILKKKNKTKQTTEVEKKLGKEKLFSKKLFQKELFHKSLFQKSLFKRKDKNLTGKIHNQLLDEPKNEENKKNFKSKNIFKRFSTIRFKLVGSFMVPIAFIILLGIVSYEKAANSIVKNYEDASIQSIDMAGEYLRFGLTSVEATSVQYAEDNLVKEFVYNVKKDDVIENNNKRKKISDSFTTKQVTDKFIQDIYFVSEKTVTVSTKNGLDNDIYAGFMESEGGKIVSANGLTPTWLGIDEYLDVKLKTAPEEYSLRLIRRLMKANALVIIDINPQTVNEILNKLKIDETGFLGIVSSDGKEITVNPKEETIFYDQSFYQDALADEEITNAKYVDYKGEQYLFMYSKIGKTGAMLCSLIPKSTITSQANGIKQNTIVIVIIACVIAALTCVLISNGIDKTIKGIISKLKKAAQGDLTVTFNSKRKDEFHTLIEEIQNTFGNMKVLIQQVKDMSGGVSDATEDVSSTSKMFLKSTEDISKAMQEIEQGISQQAKDAEECLIQMDQLSQKIEHVSENTKEISRIAEHTKGSIKDGTVVTSDLNQQTQSTIEITNGIIKQIDKLAEKSISINTIIDVISEIASRTNLLSLNASIEAARAGEFGRGFAVVASEIRKLAEQSNESVNDIKKIIDSIQEDSRSAVQIAQEASNVMRLQEGAVKNTTDSYQTINDNVESLMSHLGYITENVDNIEETRKSTLGSIESMSAVLEEIAASLNNVNQTANDQLNAVETLNHSAGNLSTDASNLVQEVEKFQI